MKRASVFGIFVSLLAAVLLMLGSTAALAQSTSGGIAGTITDESGAAIPGATVVIKSTDTGQTRTITTDGSGRYHAPELQSGTYDISAELQGFQTAVRSGLQITLGQEVTVNLVLTLGQRNEKVIVTGSASLVDTTQAGVTGIVESQQIRELPLNGRDFSQLTLLSPGVTSVPTAGRTLSRGMGTQISIAGARPNQVSYLLDGTDIADQGGQSPGSAAGGMLGVDTIREFQVLTNNYSAEYGRSAGGVVTAITRSGTNRIHGSAFEFIRNSALDAKNYFDVANRPIPPLTRNQFGVTMGGPVVKDKTFFFAAYEGLIQDRGLSVVANVPSRATRARTDISLTTKPYLLLFPEPNGVDGAATGVYSTSFNEPTRETYLVGKVDHTFSGRSSLSVRYTFDNANDLTPQAVPLWADQAHNRSQYTSLEHKWILSSAMLNVMRVSYNRTFQTQENVDQIAIDPNLFSIPGNSANQIANMTITGLSQFGADPSVPLIVALNTYQAQDTLTWTHGRHTMKSGFSLTRWYNNQNAQFDPGGNYTFTSVEDFVQGKASSFEATLPGTSADRYWRQNLIGMFVQDDVSLSRVTLNLGVRYEFISVPTEKYDRVSSYRDLQGTAATIGDPLFKNPSYTNVAPRVGFAWDLFGNGKTSIRGGAGLFYEPLLANFYRTAGNRTPPFFTQASLTNPPFPRALDQVKVPTQRLDLLQWDLENPYVTQFNATFQRELLPQTVFTIGYLGSRGFNQIRNIEYNQAIPIIQPDGSYFFPEGSTRRNPNFGSIRVRVTDGRSWFNALVTSINKRFSDGFQVQASYTYGKTVDEGSISAGSQDLDNGFQPRYGFDPLDNKGPADFDIRHNFVLNYSYDLPFARQASGVAAALAKGWQLAGVFTAHTGVPFTPVLSFDRARALPRSGGAGQWPSLNPAFTGDIITNNPDRWFDPAAFILPAAGTFGNLGRNVLNSPGYASWDFSLMKNFPIGNGRKVQFRCEVFNALNRANFGVPATPVFDSRGNVPANAGQIINTVGTARQIQLGLRLEF